MVSPPFPSQSPYVSDMILQEPPLHLQQLHNLPIRLLRLPLLHRWRHNLRLLHRPPRLLPNPRPLLRPQILPLLLHLWFSLARLHSLHLRHPHQHSRFRRRNWKTSAQRRAVHLQLEFLRRIHCCIFDVLGVMQI